MTSPPCGFILDLHNHTHHSRDGSMSTLALLRIAAAKGIDCVGVTDHGTTRGGLEAARLAQGDEELPAVIPGQEIFTSQGEIIGLYLTEDIPSGLTLEQAVEAVRAQGGLVYLPHPYDSVRRATVHRGMVERAASLADIIEVENGRSLRRSFDEAAARLAHRHGKVGGAGSDAHYAGEVGRAVFEVSRLPTRDDLVALLEEGRPRRGGGTGGRLLAWWFVIRVGVDKLRRRLAGALKG